MDTDSDTERHKKRLRMLDLERMIHSWEWGIVGGTWERGGLDEATDDLLRTCNRIEGAAQHYIERPRRFYWRRLYKPDGTIDYDLREKVEEKKQSG